MRCIIIAAQQSDGAGALRGEGARVPAQKTRGSARLIVKALCALTRPTAANLSDGLLRLQSLLRGEVVCGYKATDVESHRRVTGRRKRRGRFGASLSALQNRASNAPVGTSDDICSECHCPLAKGDGRREASAGVRTKIYPPSSISNIAPRQSSQLCSRL